MANDTKSLNNALEKPDTTGKSDSSKYYDRVIAQLKLVADQPEGHSDLFGYSKYGDKLYELLVNSLPDKPFSICLDAKGGQGKTGIMKHIFFRIQHDSPITNIIPIWYDVWKLEKFEPSYFLLTAIAKKCEDQKMNVQLLNEILNSLSATSAEASFGRQMNISPSSLAKIFESMANDTDEGEGFAELLMDKRVFIFVDNLDRCKPETINEILRAISTQFNSRKIRFFVGADIERLERKLAHLDGASYDKNDSADSLTDLDKAFQLTFVLPAKDDRMMQEYVESSVGSFPPKVKAFLSFALPRNPRRAKEALNRAFYMTSLAKGENLKEDILYVLAVSILDSSFREVAPLLHEFPEILFELALIVSRTRDHSDLLRVLSISANDRSLLLVNLKLSRESVGPLAIETLFKFVQRDISLYNFLKATADAFEVTSLTESNVRSKIIDGFRNASRL